MVRVLDVTLRDGGCVNDFNFGHLYMTKILEAQEAAGIDIIEVGYIDKEKGSLEGRTKFIDEKCIYSSLLKRKKNDISYVAMIDYGRYNPLDLEDRNKNGIDGIRLAFHKKDYKQAIEMGKDILSKGYDLYIQPMITLRYSEEELLDLIDCVNKELHDASAFYIVDSFGEMRENDVENIWRIVDCNLDKNMTVGFHSHNNLQLSYSNAMTFLKLADNTERNVIVDSSIMGMGKGAGNLNTELLLEFLNLSRCGTYRIEPLLDVIDRVLNQLYAEWRWGYSPEYYLSAINHCTPSYAGYFYNKHMLPIDYVNELLKRIDDMKKISFDENYAEEIYKKYNSEKKVDDINVVKEIEDDLSNCEVLLIAPGKSLTTNIALLNDYRKKNNCKSICLNMSLEPRSNYVITTRYDIYQELVKTDNNVIVTSNISKGGRGGVRVLDYSKWIIDDGKVRDSALVIALKLLKSCHVRKVVLAGFDGFNVDINANYYTPYLRHQLNERQVNNYNNFYKSLIALYKTNGMEISFLTPSIYDEKEDE